MSFFLIGDIFQDLKFKATHSCSIFLQYCWLKLKVSVSFRKDFFLLLCNVLSSQKIILKPRVLFEAISFWRGLQQNTPGKISVLATPALLKQNLPAFLSSLEKWSRLLAFCPWNSLNCFQQNFPQKFRVTFLLKFESIAVKFSVAFSANCLHLSPSFVVSFFTINKFFESSIVKMYHFGSYECGMETKINNRKIDFALFIFIDWFMLQAEFRNFFRNLIKFQ